MDHFFVGAATAPHQVEGNNTRSDFWTLEHLPHTSFIEPSGAACDHYHRYEEDIRLLSEAGLNAYRFGIEWARVQPEKGVFDKKEIAHYRDVLLCCRRHGIEPVVTMHHFSSPKWLISEGGWESEKTIGYFADYCRHMAEELGDLMGYVCTINEANMGLQLASLAKDILRRMSEVQVGLRSQAADVRALAKTEEKAAFGCEGDVNVFLSVRSEEGDHIIMRAHEAARDAMHAVCPHLKIGLTLSLHDIQVLQGGEQLAAQAWENEFLRYLNYIRKDDFLGVQCYTRKRFDETGSLPPPQGAPLTQMGYENYPQAIGNVLCRVAEQYSGELLVTENGIATQDDQERVAFLEKAAESVKAAKAKGVPVNGYFYWSLLDNFEWQKGFAMQFGLIGVDRKTLQRSPKNSLYALKTFFAEEGIK